MKGKTILMLLAGLVIFGTGAIAMEYIMEDKEQNPILPVWDLPEHLIPSIESHPAVLNLEEGVLDSGQSGYRITLDKNSDEVDLHDAIKLVRELEWIAIVHQARADWHITGLELPDCQWDYGTGQSIGVYYYNGTQIIVQDDDKC